MVPSLRDCPPFACRLSWTWLTLLLTLNAAALSAAETKTAHVDHYGDPLPPGAIARLGTLRLRHQGWIVCTDFSPDGKILASVGEPGIFVRLWDTASGKEIRRISGTLTDQLAVVKFSPSGRIVAGGSHDEKRNLFLWDAATGKLLHRLEGHKILLWDIAFGDPDDKILVSVDADGKVCWWNIATGAKVREWDAMSVVGKPNEPGPRKFDHIYRATFSADGRSLAAVAQWQDDKDDKNERQSIQRLILWDLDQRKQRWQLTRGKQDLFAFDLSADAKIVAVGVGAADVSIRDGVVGRELNRLTDAKENPNNWESLSLSRDGKMVAALGRGEAGVRVWDAGSGKILHQLSRNIIHGLRSSPRRLLFSPDNASLVFPWKDTLALWDVGAWTERPHLQGHRETVHFLAFSYDGKTLVSGNESHWPRWAYPQLAITWDTTTWHESVRSVEASYRLRGFLSRDHRLSVVNNPEGDFSLVEQPSGKRLRQLDIHSKHVYADGGFFSPSGRTAVQAIAKPGTKHDLELALVDAASGKPRGSLPTKVREIFLTFTSDDKTLAWIDKRAVIHVVAVDGGKELRQLGTPRDDWDHLNTGPILTFSPDSRYLAFWEQDDNDIHIWDWRTGVEYRRLPGRQPILDGSRRINLSYRVSLAFSPDGRCLAVGGMASDHDVELWELASGQLRRRIPGHIDLVRSLAFSPDGRLLASGSSDTTILIWDLYGLSLRNRPPEKPTPARLKALWADLAHTDSRKAGEALIAFIQNPSSAVCLFSEKLQPVSAADAKTVARWVADMDSDDFAVREKATHELNELAELAEPALRKALTQKPSLETRRRIEQLLEQLHRPPPDRLQLLRAVEVLEHLRTMEARQLLKRLAEGVAEARLTQDARASLERLARTSANAP